VNQKTSSELESIMWRVRQTVRATTVLEPVALSKQLQKPILIASETFQHTGSFKFRAAYCAALASKFDHLLTASSGNFGAALAYAASLLNKRCTVVMPHASSAVKIAAVKSFGAQVELVETNKISRAERVQQLANEFEDRIDVLSAYDHPMVIAGNSTLGEEIAALESSGKYDFDSVLVPIGGGGLSAGIIMGLRAKGSKLEVWAAEPAMADDAWRSFAAGEIVSNSSEPGTIADGARTLSLGKLNFEILQKELSGVLVASEAEIEAAVRHLFSAQLKAEPTGALALACLIGARNGQLKGRRPLLIVSGGNVDPAVYGRIITAQD